MPCLLSLKSLERSCMDEDQVKDESLSWVKDYIVLPDRHAGKMVFLRRDHISKMTVNLVEQSVTISADGVDTTASNLDVPFLLKKIGDPELEQSEEHTSELQSRGQLV